MIDFEYMSNVQQIEKAINSGEIEHTVYRKDIDMVKIKND